MKNLIYIMLTFFFVQAKASPNETSKKEFPLKVDGVGTATVVVEDFGEPIAAPEEIRITIRCAKTKESREVALFRFCRLESHTYEKGTKVLTLKLVSARVVHDSGDVVCDQVDRKQVDFSNICE